MQNLFDGILSIPSPAGVFSDRPQKTLVDTVSASSLHIATLDGEAMFFHEVLDFSEYAGTDVGSTPYYMEFLDSAGKKSAAYCGAAGGGEMLGAEMLPQPLFDSAVQYDLSTGWTVGGGRRPPQLLDTL